MTMRKDVKKFIIRTAVKGIFILAALAVFSGNAPGEEKAIQEKITPEKMTIADVKKELSEAMDAIRAYSADHREDAVKALEGALAKINAQMDRAGEKMKKEWDKMAPEARKKAAETMDRLRAQRDQLEKTLEEWKKSKAPAWEALKEEAVKNLEEFRKSLESSDEDIKEEPPEEAEKDSLIRL